jgi:hypothetical protein
MANKIKEEAILKYMNKLEISREEAESMYAFDQEEIGNDEADALEAKTAAAKEKAPSKIGKVLTMKAKKKADALKESIIKVIFDNVRDRDDMFDAQEMSATKLTFKDADGSYYTVSVTKHKTKPDGYKF